VGAVADIGIVERCFDPAAASLDQLDRLATGAVTAGPA